MDKIVKEKLALLWNTTYCYDNVHFGNHKGDLDNNI